MGLIQSGPRTPPAEVPLNQSGPWTPPAEVPLNQTGPCTPPAEVLVLFVHQDVTMAGKATIFATKRVTMLLVSMTGETVTTNILILLGLVIGLQSLLVGLSSL